LGEKEVRRGEERSGVREGDGEEGKAKEAFKR
jgi:hypothetical protein